MAYHLSKHIDWDSGPGSQIKYTFHLEVDVDVVSVTGNTATISVNGTYGVTNYANNTANVQKASDYALIAPGDADAWDYQFTPYTEYYQDPLPVVPNAPQSIVDRVLLEFRGDTWRSDPTLPGNSSTLWEKSSGTVLNLFHGQGETRTFNINTSFTIPISGGDTPILAFVSSGWSSGPIYEWQDHEVLVSWFELDYRPGKLLSSSDWLSHNRPSGWAGIWDGNSFKEMRTVDGGVGVNNPPLISHSSGWKNQRRVGAE